MGSNDSIKARCIDLAKHAIGLNGRRRPYTRNGKQYYKPYRNYFATSLPCEPWEMMTWAGYAVMRRQTRDGQPIATFWLTREGLDWLGEQLGVYIYDESN